jgi:hypothetical protein
MVTRRALLIGNSGGYRNLHLLNGVKIDLDNYRNFLTSKAGGQWYNHEITTLVDPDENTVLKAVQQSNADYSFIAFSGHGFINSYTASDYVCLKDKDLSTGKLVSPSAKQTIVIDACREIITEVPEDLTKVFSLNESRQFEGINTRELFDEAIQSMPSGVLVVYSTQPNESAGDDDYKGGHFTYSFIQAGRNWWNAPNNKGILRIDIAVTEAEKIMKSKFITTQSPAMGGQVRRLTFPPFAFGKF